MPTRLPTRPARLVPLAALLACVHAPAPAPRDAAAGSATAALPVDAAMALRPLPPRPWSGEILYFVLVDRFVDGDPTPFEGLAPGNPGAFHGGDLRGLAAHLDEIASLGVTAIWLNPLVKQMEGAVTGAGFPDWPYHGYWADDFTRLDPRFGSEADLAALVQAAHARGLRVLLDVVYNHPGYRGGLVTDPATARFLRRSCGPDADDLTSCLAGLPDFETERPEVREWLISAQLPWARRFGLDGFRLDTVKHVDHAFWQVHRQRVRAEVSKDFFLLGEVWGGDREVLDPWFAGDELDAGFDFGFQGSTVGWVMGRGRSVAYARYLETRHKVRPGKLLAHFLSSHDVEGALSLLGGDRAGFRLAAALQLTTAGLPTIYYGEEVGRSIGKWPENRSDMPWGDRGLRPGAGVPRDEGLRDWYRRLIAIRRDHPALAGGTHRTLSAEGDLLVFLREQGSGGDAVVVAVNRGSAPASARVERPPGWGAQPVSELLGAGGVVEGDGSGLRVTLPARSAAVLGLGGPIHP